MVGYRGVALLLVVVAPYPLVHRSFLERVAVLLVLTSLLDPSASLVVPSPSSVRLPLLVARRMPLSAVAVVVTLYHPQYAFLPLEVLSAGISLGLEVYVWHYLYLQASDLIVRTEHLVFHLIDLDNT